MTDMLSQEEINALLGGAMDDPDDNFDDLDDFTDGEIAFDDITLTDEEKDVLGELGNISIGTSATTLFALLGQRVIITTPVVYVVKLSEIGDNYEKPCVGIRVDYTAGIKGTNVLLLNHNDVKVITSLMMGWGGDINPDEELNDMDISAIQEAMNQMIGSASTSLASLVNTKIDIATPIASIIDFNRSDLLENLGFDEEYAVAVEFRMEIGTLVDSNIMQLLPMNFARYMVEVMTSSMSPPQEQPKESSKEEKPAPTPDAATDALPSAAKPDTMSQQALQEQPETSGPEGSIAMNQTQTYAEQQPGNYAPPPGQQPQYVPQPQVAAQAAQFQSFDVSDVMQQKENIEIIMDVPLEVTVELGRTSRKIRDILEFSPGSIIELNKLAGEPIDILVNGKFVAKGEVVVIDENFGIRITDIVNAEHRI